MKQLGTINYSPKLTEVECNFLVATNTPIFVSLLESDKIGTQLQLTDLVSRCLNVLGQTKKAEDISILVLGLCDEVKIYFPNLTAKELELALNLGIRGEYGEFFGFSIQSCHKFIKEYLNGEKRREAILKQREHEAELSRVKTQEEIDKIETEFWESEEKRVTDFKKTGILKTDSYSTLFKIYENAGKIFVSTPKKWEYYNQAKEIVVKELQDLAIDSLNVKPITKQIERIKSGNMTKEDDAKVVDASCRLIMEQYFKGL